MSRTFVLGFGLDCLKPRKCPVGSALNSAVADHYRPQSLRAHALHYPISIKPNNKSISSQIIIVQTVNPVPRVIEFRPRVSSSRLTVIRQLYHLILIIRQAALLDVQFSRVYAEVVEIS